MRVHGGLVTVADLRICKLILPPYIDCAIMEHECMSLKIILWMNSLPSLCYAYPWSAAPESPLVGNIT